MNRKLVIRLHEILALTTRLADDIKTARDAAPIGGKAGLRYVGQRLELAERELERATARAGGLL